MGSTDAEVPGDGDAVASPHVSPAVVGRHDGSESGGSRSERRGSGLESLRSYRYSRASAYSSAQRGRLGT